MKRSITAVPAILAVLFSACVATSGDVNAGFVRNDSVNVNVKSVPDEMQFETTGTGKEFTDARPAAYVNMVTKAVIYLIGSDSYNKNKSGIDSLISPWTKARYYILGETTAAPGKEKKWLGTSKDADGNMVIKMQAWVNLKKLKADLDGMGVSAPEQKTPDIVVKDGSSSVVKLDNGGSSSSAPEIKIAQPEVDVSGVDISSLTFLVYYNPSDPSLQGSKEDIGYAKWCVDEFNKQLAGVGVKTFDVDTMEKLMKERNLMQEASTGSVGVGLLLAQQVYAEMYAEVAPSISYTGSKVTISLNIKIFIRTTGALVTTVVKGAEFNTAPNAAGIKAAIKLATQKAMPDVVLSLKKYMNGGRFFNVRLAGVGGYNDARKFNQAVSKLPGVVNMNLKSGTKADAVYDYDIQFKGSPMDLVDRIFDGVADKPGYEKFDLREIRGNEITFTLND